MYDDFPTKDRSKRAKRRHDHIRKLEKAKNVGRLQFRYSATIYTQDELNEMVDTWARHHAENLAACSCYMCGNARKYWKDLTFQEKKNLVAYKEQLNSLDSDE